MPPTRGRSTVIVRRPRIRPPEQQEATASTMKPPYGGSKEREPRRDLSQSERGFSHDRYHYPQKNRTFHSTNDLNFERAYTQNERFPPGDRRNNNCPENYPYFANYSGPQNQTFPGYSAQGRMDRFCQYPQNQWESVPLPPQNKFQVNPNQPGTSCQPPQNQASVSHQIKNASQYSQYQNKKKNITRTNSQASSSRPGSTVETGPISHASQVSKEVNEHYKMYTCPDCHENYTYKYHQTRLVGKLPLMLHCSHTVCQECIYKKLSCNKIVCPVCQHENVLARNQTPVSMVDLQKPFQPNFHVLGMMFFGRPPGGFLGNLDNIKLVSNMEKKNDLPAVTERCCFGTCIKEATMYCPICDGIFCKDCCTVVHKSTKTLMCHEPVQRKQKTFSLKLDACSDHPEMLLEFYCKDCDLNACCYCVLDQHGNHDRVPLCQLTDSEKEEFRKQKEHAVLVLKEVLAMQKKASKLSNFSTLAIKREIASHFADRHAKLYAIERKLFDEISEVKTTSKGLDTIQASLKQNADILKQLIKFDLRNLADQKLNLRGALQKLKLIENEPRFLLNNEGIAEPVRFVNNFTEDDNDVYQIVKCEDAEYKLVSKYELPEDYVFEELPEVESELEQLTKMSESVSNLSVLDDNKIRYPSSEVSRQTAASGPLSKSRPTQKKSSMEKVEVQHINSMDSFFIQYKHMQCKLNALSKDIENYVKMGAAENVVDPDIHSCYLVLYVTEGQGNTKEQKWCRGRIVDVKQEGAEDLYEAFFIDYGKTQLVKGNRIKDIPQFLLKHKPFAVECKLYNPMDVDWNKKAHFTLAKVLNGKQVTMAVKCTLPTGVLEVDLMVSSSDGGVTSVIDILVYTTNSGANDDAASVEDSPVGRKDVYFPQLKVFPNNKRFTKNQTEKVVLANVIDPHNVFVHMEAHKEAFKNMTHLMKKAYKQSRNNGTVPIEGTYVLLEYRDPVRSNWHRAFIKSVDLDTDQVHAVLVDWGLSVMVPTASIRPMQESCTKLEAQAVLVKLAHIAPFNKQAMWSAHAATFLQTYLTTQEVLKMVVQDVDTEISVALFDMSGNCPACINALLVEQNYADSTGPMSIKTDWPQYEVETSHFNEDEGVLASMLKKVDEAESDSGEEDCRQITKLQVEVVKAVSPEELYVKFLSFRDKEAQLFREINIHYDEEEERKTKEKWTKDDLCVVELNNQYNRGKIVGEAPGGVSGYKVWLYDKAEEIEAKTDKIYTYHRYFGQFANVAIRSHLANIRPAGDTGKWSISSVEALQAIFQKRKRLFACKADEADTDPSKKSMPLDMWYGIVIPGGALEPDHMKYVCINQSLVKVGFAYRKPGVSSFEKAINAIAVPKNDELDIITKRLEMLNQTDDKKEIGLKSIKMGIKEMLQHENLEKKLSKIKSVPKKDGSKPVFSSSEGESSVSSSKTVTTKHKKSKKPKEKEDKKEKKSPEKKEEVKEIKGTSGNEAEKETTEIMEKEEFDTAQRKTPVDWNALVEAEVSLDIGDQPSTSKIVTSDRSDKSDRSCANSDKDEQSDGSVKESDSPYHRKEVDISDWLPPFRLTKREFRAKVTCVETGGHLYLHEESIHEAYENLEENIRAYFDTNPPKTEDDSYWQHGRLCTIKYEDGKWYRGRVLKVKAPNLITVFMIDFGSDHDVSPDVLYREVLYTDIEAFATKVKLDKVYAKDGVWLSSDYDAFIDLVTDWCQIKVVGPINVEIPLVEVTTDNGVHVNEELVKISQNLVSRLIGVENYPEEQEEDLLFIEEEFREQNLPDDVSEHGSNKTDPVEQGIATISCNSMLDWKFKVQPLPAALFKGEKVLLEVGGILSYNRIAIKECGQNTSEDFYNLIIDIQDCADNVPQLTDLKVGVPCIAVFSEDAVWYRATVSSIEDLPIGKVEVYFVDYGNSELVNLTDVHAIRTDWLEYPQQTWETRLGFKPKDVADQEEVYEKISLLAGTRKFVKLISAVPLVVDLYDKDELCYQNLVDLGLIELDEQP